MSVFFIAIFVAIQVVLLVAILRMFAIVDLPDPADPRFGCVLSTPQRQTPCLMSALRRVCGRRLVQW
jgi:hypothetical protein